MSKQKATTKRSKLIPTLTNRRALTTALPRFQRTTLPSTVTWGLLRKVKHTKIPRGSFQQIRKLPRNKGRTDLGTGNYRASTADYRLQHRPLPPRSMPLGSQRVRSNAVGCRSIVRQGGGRRSILIIESRRANRVNIITNLGHSNAPGVGTTKTRRTRSFLHFSHRNSMLSGFFSGFFQRYVRPGQFSFCQMTARNLRGILAIVGRVLGGPSRCHSILTTRHISAAGCRRRTRRVQRRTRRRATQDITRRAPSNANKRQRNSTRDRSTRARRRTPSRQNCGPVSSDHLSHARITRH